MCNCSNVSLSINTLLLVFDHKVGNSLFSRYYDDVYNYL